MVNSPTLNHLKMLLQPHVSSICYGNAVAASHFQHHQHLWYWKVTVTAVESHNTFHHRSYPAQPRIQHHLYMYYLPNNHKYRNLSYNSQKNLVCCLLLIQQRKNKVDDSLADAYSVVPTNKAILSPCTPPISTTGTTTFQPYIYVDTWKIYK